MSVEEKFEVGKGGVISGEKGKAGETPFGKTRDVCDLVFVVDKSGSMAGVINALQNNIVDFIKAIENDPTREGKKIDWRVGLVAHNGWQKDGYTLASGNLWFKTFTNSPEEFEATVARLPDVSGSEITFPAIDFAADFEWRKEPSHRIIIVITDEPLEGGGFGNGGEAPEWQKSKIEELIKKLTDMKIQVLFYGVLGTTYTDFCDKTYKGTSVEIDLANFRGDQFVKLLEKIGRTVSKISAGNAQIAPAGQNKDIYGLKKMSNVTITEIR